MWLAFPSLFDFGAPRPRFHRASNQLLPIFFYGMRVIDMNDDLPKWSAHDYTRISPSKCESLDKKSIHPHC